MRINDGIPHESVYNGHHLFGEQRLRDLDGHEASAGSKTDARIPIMAMTTSSSISVKPFSLAIALTS